MNQIIHLEKYLADPDSWLLPSCHELSLCLTGVRPQPMEDQPGQSSVVSPGCFEPACRPVLQLRKGTYLHFSFLYVSPPLSLHVLRWILETEIRVSRRSLKKTKRALGKHSRNISKVSGFWIEVRDALPKTEVPLCRERNWLRSVACQLLIRHLANGSCSSWVESFELAISVNKKWLNIDDFPWSYPEFSGEAQKSRELGPTCLVLGWALHSVCV